MELTEAVRRRRMVRNYSDRPVPRDIVERLVWVARRAPSAGFSQGQRFVVVMDPARRRAIAALADEDAHAERGFDRWLSAAPVHVVLCIDRAAYEQRYAAADKRASGGRVGWPVAYEAVDAGAALMLLLLAAVDEGLAAGFFGAHRLPGLKHVLRIPDGVDVVGIVTIGYPAPDRASGSLRRGWRPIDDVVHWEEWG